MCDLTGACTKLILVCCIGYAAGRGDAQTSRVGEVPESHAGHFGMAGMDMGTSLPENHAKTTRQPASEPAVPGNASIRIPREIQQRIGVTVGRVERGPLVMAVRTVGILRPNETKVTRVHLKTEGWVAKLFVSFTGQKVKKGDPLLSIYSPQFLVAQQEYLTALRGSAAATGGGLDSKSMIEAARRKLELLDVPADEVDQLQRTGEVRTTLTLRTLTAGTVLEKKAFEGQYVTAADELYVLADLSTVWVQAKVYEYELPHVVVGQPVSVTLPSLPGRELKGKVVFIDPVVEELSRTAQVRIELPNLDGTLKPGMFSHVVITHPMGDGLLIPTEAVIRSGDQDIAFRVEAPDRFVPVKVGINPVQFGDFFQVLDGLREGEQVVTSANFLIDSESRLQAGAGGGMAGMPGMEMGNMPGMEGNEKGEQDTMPGMQHH